MVLVMLLSLVFSLWPSGLGFGGNIIAAERALVEVEAEPVDDSIELEGPRHPISYIDESIEGKADYIALFSYLYGEQITIPRYYVAVQVNAQNEVLHVVNPSINGAPPAWEPAPVELAIPEGGFVLMAHDDSYANKGIKKYLATYFQVGDVIKLRKDGQVTALTDLISDGPKPSIQTDQLSMFTVNEPSVTLSGSVTRFDPLQGDVLTVGGESVPVDTTGAYQIQVSLEQGVNYIDAVLERDGESIVKASSIVYYKPGPVTTDEEVLMWVDQASNAHKFQSSEDILTMLEKAAASGVTGVILDVKGYEGFASYQQNDLTGRPYVSNMSGPARGGANPDLDLLEEFVKHGHSLGLTVHAAVNVFAEGSMYENAVLDDHPEWEEMVYRPQDHGEIVPIRQSAAPNKIVAFVNPAHDEVRQYQLDTFEEIMKNYDVDGINLDRGRYDNDFADFSETTRVKFAAYLAERGKTLEAWPGDVYKLEFDANGQATRVEGQHYLDWWAFRAETITSFTEELRVIVDEYSALKGKDIKVSTYVGSWYQTMYVHGINWASPDFRYDERLGFAEDRIYTEDYYSTGYTGNLDFIMIGTYQSTEAEIEKYMTLGNILTRGDIPLYASVALANIQEPELQRQVFQSMKQKTDGMMLFDYSQVNFDMIKAALNDEVYVKPYQLGISIPGEPEQFIEADYYNVNRNENNINVYDEGFGPSAGTNQWGVEMAVDGSGIVMDTANKQQAMNWNWAGVEENDTAIPDGGFVISAADPSGVRVKRQLVANAYSVGDAVRAALLEGHLAYNETRVNVSQLELAGTVTVLGYGEQLDVRINGKKAKLDGNRADGNGQKLDLRESIPFFDKVELEQGVNEIMITVYVDGMKTNEKTISVTLE